MKKQEEPKITTADLINYSHGIIDQKRKAQIEHYLETDEFARMELEGLMALEKDFPDEDPESFLETAAWSLKKKLEEHPNYHITIPPSGNDFGPKPDIASEVEKPKVIKGQFSGWIKYAAAAVIVFGIGIPLYFILNKPAETTNQPLSETEHTSNDNKDHSSGSYNSPKKNNKGYIAMERGEEEFAPNKNSADSLPNAQNKESSSSNLKNSLYSIIEKENYQIQGRLKAEINVLESKHQMVGLVNNFNKGEIVDLGKVLESKEKSLTGNESFCLGYIYLKENKDSHQKAITLLKRAALSSDVKSDANYFLGIAYALEGEKDLALSALSKTSHPNAQTALSLLENP